MPRPQTRQDAPLLDMQAVRLEDGPSLSLAIHVSGSTQLQGICVVPNIHFFIQLGMLRQLRVVDVERTLRGERIP